MQADPWSSLSLSLAYRHHPPEFLVFGDYHRFGFLYQIALAKPVQFLTLKSKPTSCFFIVLENIKYINHVLITSGSYPCIRKGPIRPGVSVAVWDRAFEMANMIRLPRASLFTKTELPCISLHRQSREKLEESFH